MNKVKVTSLICGGMISLAGPTLLAQSSTSSGQSSTSGLGQSSTSGSSQYQGSSSSSALGSSSSSMGMEAGQHVRLSELMHAPVQGKDGKQLGHIRDFTVDPQSGRIEFAVLSLGAGGASGTSGTGYTGGTSGTSSSSTSSSSTSSGLSSSTGAAGGKLIPVPWQLFTESWTGTQHGSTTGSSSTTGTSSTGAAGTMGTPTLVLNVDESQLQNAPSIQGGNWNELQQSSFAQQVYSHFNVSRSSATGMPGSSISGGGASGSKSYGGSSSHGSSSQGGSSSSQGSSSGSQDSSTQPQR